MVLISQGCCKGVPLHFLVRPRHSRLAIFFHIDTDLLGVMNSTIRWAEVKTIY